MLIGFSINEGLFLATLATGACWVAWRLRLRRLGSVPAKKPWWVHFGAELFVPDAVVFAKGDGVFCHAVAHDRGLNKDQQIVSLNRI